ncbi:MAG: nuclear transport factor 2 family protein [Blastocatellales bacterium]
MNKQNPETAEQEFFTALIEANAEALAELLADDFLLIDVMSGSEVSKAALLEMVGARHLQFNEINRMEFRVRHYGVTAVITGRTEMRGVFAEQPFQASSRYTHVLVGEGERWRIVSAQGTQITSPSTEA